MMPGYLQTLVCYTYWHSMHFPKLVNQCVFMVIQHTHSGYIFKHHFVTL